MSLFLFRTVSNWDQKFFLSLHRDYLYYYKEVLLYANFSNQTIERLNENYDLHNHLYAAHNQV